MGKLSNKKNEVEVLQIVDCATLLDLLNNIDSTMSISYPVVFRSVNEDGEKGAVTSAGIDAGHHFIWKDDVLGNLMFLNVEIWENTRIENIFTDYLCEDKFEDKFEILEGSFTGNLLPF